MERITAVPDELIEALQAYQQAEERVRELCRRIANAAPPQAVAAPSQRRARAAAAADAAPPKRRRGRPRKDPNKPACRSQVQVRCQVCQKIINGAREIGGQFYPYRHENAVEEPCSGRDKPGVPIMPADQDGN